MNSFYKFIIAVFLFAFCTNAGAYDIKFGNYYFNRLTLTKTEIIDGIKTYYYNVEATSKEGGYSSFEQTYSGPIEPPATFSEHNTSANESFVYTLTRISDMAFANNANATELTIPETVTEISDMGFLAHMQLTKVTCLAKKPPVHDSYYVLFLQSVTDNATLYVPDGSKSLYQSASGWREFTNIIELSPSIDGHDYVDLGLPSGNLWSTMNYGTSYVTGYGKYLEWPSLGEIEKNWGPHWGVPTISEYAELLNNCTWTWTTQGGINGYNVQGRNGKTLFLPAAGFQISGYPESTGKGIYYWSDTEGSDGFSFMLSGNSLSVNVNTTYNTSFTSAPVRPIVRVVNVVGDVNTDGEVNIADVNAVIYAILSGSSNLLADVNTDGEINIADVNKIIAIILGDTQPTTPSIQTFTVNGVSFKMIPIEGGTFTMGATAEQEGDALDDEYPPHLVTLSDYMIGQTEVTQELWVAVMGNNPSRFSGHMQRPVERLEWSDCQNFIQRLNSITGKHFRLPTEAEWEYAARGGNKSLGNKYSGSNDLSEIAWYGVKGTNWLDPNYGTHDVGTKKPNELDLYDMSGNVWEWCQDRYGEYSAAPQENPTGPNSNSKNIYRGGAWEGSASDCRVSYRNICTMYTSFNIGLRLAL